MAGGPGLDQKHCGGNHLLSPWPIHSSSLTLSSRIIHSQVDPRTMKELFCARPGLSQDTLRSRSRTEGPMPWLPPSQLFLSPPPSPSRYGRAFVCTRSEVSGMRDLVGEVGGEAAVAVMTRCVSMSQVQGEPCLESLFLFMLSQMSYREVIHLMTETLRRKAWVLQGPPGLAWALSSCPQLFALLSRGLTFLHRRLGNTCRHFGLNGPSGILPWGDLAVPVSAPESSCVFVALSGKSCHPSAEVYSHLV